MFNKIDIAFNKNKLCRLSLRKLIIIIVLMFVYSKSIGNYVLMSDVKSRQSLICIRF